MGPVVSEIIGNKNGTYVNNLLCSEKVTLTSPAEAGIGHLPCRQGLVV
jgi:hypothetical protein